MKSKVFFAILIAALAGQPKEEIMAFKYKLHEISEFEREKYRLKIEEELETLSEIQGILEDSLAENKEENREFYEQRAKTFKLKSHLEHQKEMIRVEQSLKMLTLNLCQLKSLEQKLKKRLIRPIKNEQLKEKILFLQHKLEEEIAQEEMEQKIGFKSFFITLDELQILNELDAV